MSRTVSVIAVFTVFVAAFATLAVAVTELQYPDTAPGRHAAAYFTAYNSGSEDAMKLFYQHHVSAEGLKMRSVAERLTVYRGMREEQGALTPMRVTASDDTSVTLVVRNQRGDALSMTFLCEDTPPHAMLAIRVMDQPGDHRSEEVKPEGAEAKPKTDAELVSVLRSHLDALAGDDAFSGAVLVAKSGTPLFREAYGFASRESRTPNRPDTKFNLGSINKAFTRMAIEQLATEGKLETSDTIDRHVPEYPADKGRRITIRQLLDHRGGVPDIFGPAYDATDRTKLREIKDWIPLFASEPLRFEPGTREEYSNGGYVLLGRVIENVSKQRYYDYVRERIFEPAGMESTDSYAQDELVANRATPYTRRFASGKDVWKDASSGNPARGSSAGGGYSTVDDLLRFATAVREHRPGAGARRAGPGIAGGSPGTNALLDSLGDYTIVVLANMDPPAAERLGAKIRAWIPGPGAPPSAVVREVRAGGPENASPKSGEVPKNGTASLPPGAVVRKVHAGGPEDPSRKPRETRIPEAGVDVPMLHSGHLPAVHVMLNGQGPFLFAIDTGAAGHAHIDAALVTKLGLPTIGEARSGDPSGKNVQTVPLVSIDAIEIGGARFAGLTASARSSEHTPPGERVDGILGFGLFRDCLFTLDYPAERIRLSRGELPRSGPGVLAYEDPHGIPMIKMRIGKLELDTDVDAGAMGGFSIPESAAARLSFSSEPKVVGRARTTNNTFEIKAAPLDGDVVLGDLVFTKPVVEIQPLFPTANIGSRILRDFRITFDQKNRRMKLERR